MRTQAPIISIIIPAYNHEQWVIEAIESVRQQHFMDWELILIDDASTDHTWDRVTAWQAEHADLPCYFSRHDHNQGASATLNEGLALARGEYIAILNSDDAWHVERLSYLYQTAQAKQLDFIATPVTLWNEQSHSANQQEPHWQAWYNQLVQAYQQRHDFLGVLLRGNFLISTSNFFFHRRVFETLGGFTALRYVHDYEYALRVGCSHFATGFLTDAHPLYYRLHHSNTIREKPLAAISENVQMLLHFWRNTTSAPFNPLHQLDVVHHLEQLHRYYEEGWLAEVHERLVAKEAELFPLITDRDQWIQDRDQLISQQAQWIADREHWIQERDRHIASLQALQQSQQAWIAHRDQWIQERDQLIQHLQTLIQQQQQWLIDRDGWIAERDQWIVDRDTMIQQLTHAQRNLQAELVQYQTQLSERNVWVADRDRWIQERDQWLSALQHERDALLQSRAYRLGRWLLKPIQKLKLMWNAQKWRVGHA